MRRKKSRVNQNNSYTKQISQSKDNHKKQKANQKKQESRPNVNKKKQEKKNLIPKLIIMQRMENQTLLLIREGHIHNLYLFHNRSDCEWFSVMSS